MARYLGSKHRLCRRVGMKLCSNTKCPVVRRAYPAGVHGPKGTKKLTEYATQLLEKQKAKRIYGVLERQFKRYYSDAMRKKGDTSIYLTRSLEQRLDNVVYRLGLAKTRAQARQLVVHGHVTVNARRVDRPSYAVRVNDVIATAHAPKEIEKREPLSWVTFDAAAGTAKVTNIPDVATLPEKLNTRLIIEFYSR